MIRRLLSREEVEIGKNVNSVHNVDIAQLPDELYALVFSFCSIKILGRCGQCSKDFLALLNESQAAIPIWRQFISNNENKKAYDLTVDTLSAFNGDGRHPATLYKLLCKRQLRGEVEIVILSMSGKKLSVTIKLNDDKYTMKQRVRKVQELSDGFSLEDFDLVYSRTGQRLGVYGDVKEFSPHSMSNIFRYTANFTMAVIPSLAEFSAARVNKAAQWTNTLEELVDGGIFQQVLFGGSFNKELLKSLIENGKNNNKKKNKKMVVKRITDTWNNNNNNSNNNAIVNTNNNENQTSNITTYEDDFVHVKDVDVDLKAEIGIIKSTGAFNHPKYNKTIYTGLTSLVQNMENVANNIRQFSNSNHAREMYRNHEVVLKYKVKAYNLLRKGAIGNSFALINSRVNIKDSCIGITKDETANALITFIQACDYFLWEECGYNSWKFGPCTELLTYHPFIHIVTSPSPEVTIGTRFKALKCFIKTIVNNIFRKRFMWTSFLSGAFSRGAIATITRTFFGLSMPIALSNLLTLLVSIVNPYKPSIRKLAGVASRNRGISESIRMTTKRSMNRMFKFVWKPLGNTNLINYSLRTINFQSVLRYGDGAILLLLIQMVWKMMISSLPLVFAASCEELVASTCRLIWHKEASFKYYNLWYMLLLTRISLPDNVLNTLRFKRRNKIVLTHYLDFMLSSICYRILNQFIPTHVLSMAPLYVYILPVLGLLGIANVY